MAQNERPRGQCGFCGKEYTAGGLARHIPACSGYKAAVEAANQGDGERQTIYYLYIKDDWDEGYWLHLEMNGSATLAELDRYLRGIWLECCGHMSRFGDWREDELPKDWRADRAFEPGMKITHLYDFGTTSRTLIRVSRQRAGKPLSEHPIKLLARNDPPEFSCHLCDKPATWWCYECASDFDDGLLCDEHEEAHRATHGEEMVMPIVNSPRVGMCSYYGPAEPPY